MIYTYGIYMFVMCFHGCCCCVRYRILHSCVCELMFRGVIQPHEHLPLHPHPHTLPLPEGSEAPATAELQLMRVALLAEVHTIQQHSIDI